MSETWAHREVRLLLDLDDYNAFRRFAFDNRYGDSAYAFRRLLERAGLRDDASSEAGPDGR